MHTFTRFAGALLGLALFAAAFLFTSILLAIAAAGALMLWCWIMWRTRHARRAAGRAAQNGEALVIEGEYVVDRDENGPRGKDPEDSRG